MSRTERPLDPNGDPLQAFAARLRTLREDAGRPTYAALARRTHRSPSTLSEAAGGRKFPSLDTTLAYVRALGGDGQRVAGHQSQLLAGTAGLAGAAAAGQGQEGSRGCGGREEDAVARHGGGSVRRLTHIDIADARPKTN